jgi:glycosyltransferase involved in cell wall biosynthesis
MRNTQMAEISNKPVISVIITVKNEEKRIGKCLSSIISQSLHRDLFEIIIIDGNSSDDTATIVTGIISHTLGTISFIQQDGKGISNARNTGIRHSRGDILVFIDGDAIADKECLKEYYTCFQQNSDFGFAWGTVLLGNPESLVAKLLFASHYPTVGPHGANIAYSGKVLKNSEGFDEDFQGRGDDTVVNLKIVKAGYRSIKCNKSLVYHDLPDSVREFLKIRYLEGISTRKIFHKYFDSQEKRHHTIRFFIKLLGIIISLAVLLILLLQNMLFFVLVFLAYSLCLIVMFSRLGGKFSNLNPLLVLASVYLTTLGYIAETAGEIKFLCKNY